MGIQYDGIWKGYKKGSLTVLTDIGRCEDTWHLLKQQSFAIGYDVRCWFLSTRQSAYAHYPRAAEWAVFVVGWQCRGQFGIRDMGCLELDLGLCTVKQRDSRCQSVGTSTEVKFYWSSVLVMCASCVVEVNGIGLGGEETATWKLSRLQGVGPIGMPADDP